MASIYQSIEILSKEKGIDPQIVLDAVKDAMLVAARKHYRTTGELVAELDSKSGAIQIFEVRKVVENVEDPDREIALGEALRHDPGAALDSEVRFAVKTDALGRISAQTAKQVILQKVREAERESVYAEFVDRVGELVNCTVKRVEGPDLLVDIGKTEARLPRKEQSRAENFSVGDRVRGVIKSVEKAGKNAGVTVSRAAPELVMRLFEQEVPEIYDGTVVIKGCAREAGERTKIAVASRDRDVDSVGACVGMKGMRVQSIIRELRGEKIDIIQYSDEPVVFVTNALSPAKITRVAILDAAERHMEVIVDDSQLSLAIGKKGQNVRLAAKLLGWHIDIKSEEEKRQEVESEMAALVVPGAPVSALLDQGISEEVVDKLTVAGIATVEQLGGMTPEQLEEIPGIGLDMVGEIQSAVVNYYGQFEEALEPAATEPGEEPAAAEPGEEMAAAEPGEDGSDTETGGQELTAEPAFETREENLQPGEPVADETGAAGLEEIALESEESEAVEAPEERAESPTEVTETQTESDSEGELETGESDTIKKSGHSS